MELSKLFSRQEIYSFCKISMTECVFSSVVHVSHLTCIEVFSHKYCTHETLPPCSNLQEMNISVWNFSQMNVEEVKFLDSSPCTCPLVTRRKISKNITYSNELRSVLFLKKENVFSIPKRKQEKRSKVSVCGCCCGVKANITDRQNIQIDFYYTKSIFVKTYQRSVALYDYIRFVPIQDNIIIKTNKIRLLQRQNQVNYFN